jgi:hypothetical protein
MQGFKSTVRGCQGPRKAVYYTLDSRAGGFTFAVKKLKWLECLLNRQILQRIMKGKEQVPACRMGAQARPGKAQRYGPRRQVRREYGRLALAARPAAWCAKANLTGGHGRSSDCSGILFRKKI